MVNKMPDKSKKSRTKNSRKWVKRFIYILIIVTLFGWSYSPIKTRMAQRRQIERLKDQLVQEHKENEKLTVELERLRGDSEYIESIARQKLGMVKVDEEGYVVIDKDGGGDSGNAPDDDSDKNVDNSESWWQRIFSIFGR